MLHGFVLAIAHILQSNLSSVQSVCSSQVSTTLRFPEETRVDSVYAKVTEPIEVSMQVLYYAKQASASVVLIWNIALFSIN